MSSFEVTSFPFLYPLLRTFDKMVASDRLVLTGATGFLGFKTLDVALKAGYNVCIVVRSASKGDRVLAAPSVRELNPSSEKLS